MNRHHRLHTENKKLNCREVFFSSRVEPTETNCSESVRVWTSRESGWDLSWWKWPWPCGVKISLRRKPDHFPPHTLHNPTQIFSGEKKNKLHLAGCRSALAWLQYCNHSSQFGLLIKITEVSLHQAAPREAFPAGPAWCGFSPSPGDGRG